MVTICRENLSRVSRQGTSRHRGLIHGPSQTVRLNGSHSAYQKGRLPASRHAISIASATLIWSRRARFLAHERKTCPCNCRTRPLRSCTAKVIGWLMHPPALEAPVDCGQAESDPLLYRDRESRLQSCRGRSRVEFCPPEMRPPDPAGTLHF